MNSLSLKSKSLFYSIVAHLSIALIVVILMYTSQETSSCACGSTMKMTKLNLASIPLEQTPEKFEKVTQEEKTISKPVAKTQYEIKKIIKPTRPALKQVELKAVEKKVLVAKEEKKIQTLEKPKTEVSKVNQVKKVKETIVAQDNAQQSATAVQSENDLKIACEKKYMQDNVALINALIKQNLFYPRLAKKRGMEGKAMVSFVLNTHGEITQINALGEIASILSRAAIKTVQKAAASFPHPKASLSLQIPIVYKLAQR